MPFADEMAAVYEKAIRPVTERHLGIGSVWRADDTYRKDKMSEIKTNIQSAALVIVDVSGAKPAVMWEHGYCDALNKTMIVLSQGNAGEMPFNIRAEAIVQYTNTEEGLAMLREKLDKVLLGVVPVAKTMQRSCLYSFSWRKSLETIHDTLAALPSDSFRAEFAERELKRVTNQMAGLQNGLYTLRKTRPMDEIISCYCDLLGKMHVSDPNEPSSESFDTVTCIDFWREFTEEGRDSRYLGANIEAAMRGVKIRRILLLDARRRGDGGSHAKQIGMVIRDLHTACEKWAGQILLRVYESKTYNADIENVYTNFAIFRSGEEHLLLQPQYANGTGLKHMTKTEFTWSGTGGTGPDAPENAKIIKRFKARFQQLWDESRDLNSQFLDEYFTPTDNDFQVRHLEGAMPD